MTIHAILVLALAAFPAGARTPASFDVSVDPRFELLGVVQRLSGRARADDAAAGYRERVDGRFAAFREHAAVASYRELASIASREEASATILLYYTDPPELKLKDKNADIHYLNGPGDAEAMHRFLHELRGFARDSDFMGFYRENRGYYAELERAARVPLGGIDPIAEIERYLGMSLATRARYILAPLNPAARAFISPYPLPPSNAGAKAFEAYTVAPGLLGDVFSNSYWHEPLYVFVDPGVYYFEKLNVPSPEDFYGPEVARCRASSPNCVKELAVNAIIEHLNRKAGLPSVLEENEHFYGELERARIKALSARLDEYDARRDRYPTLWDFFPRWFGVFEEAAFPGRAPRRLSVPAEPRIRAAPDFFDPALTSALLRTGAR